MKMREGFRIIALVFAFPAVILIGIVGVACYVAGEVQPRRTRDGRRRERFERVFRVKAEAGGDE